MLPYVTIISLKKLGSHMQPYVAICAPYLSTTSPWKLASPYVIICCHMHPYTIICDRKLIEDQKTHMSSYASIYIIIVFDRDWLEKSENHMVTYGYICNCMQLYVVIRWRKSNVASETFLVTCLVIMVPTIVIECFRHLFGMHSQLVLSQLCSYVANWRNIVWVVDQTMVIMSSMTCKTIK